MRFTASRLALLAVLGSTAIALSACSDISDMFGSSDDTAAAGSPFTQGLATAYADLANQADALPDADDGGFFSPITDLFDFSEKPKDMLKRAFTAKAEYPVLDNFVYATTSPIYVSVRATRPRSGEDARYFVAWIDHLIETTARYGDWNSAAEKAGVIKELTDARLVYQQLE